MGIQNLLQVLKNVTRSVHISELRGKRVAVDGYYWLHRGAYACSKDICTGNRTNKFLGYGISMIEVLESYNITPIIVFDGSPLPSKGGEEADREARRKENMKLALETQRKGDEICRCQRQTVSKPVQRFQRAYEGCCDCFGKWCIYHG